MVMVWSAVARTRSPWLMSLVQVAPLLAVPSNGLLSVAACGVRAGGGAGACGLFRVEGGRRARSCGPPGGKDRTRDGDDESADDQRKEQRRVVDGDVVDRDGGAGGLAHH